MTSKLKKLNNHLLVGKILRAHGIKGELKVLPLTNTPEDFTTIKSVFIDNVEYKTEDIRVANTNLIIRLLDVTTRNDAEKFHGKDIYVDSCNRPVIAADEYFIADLVGMEITDGLNVYGTLESVIKTGGVDVYCVNGTKHLMFPALKTVILDIDFKTSKITVSSDELVKVAVYDDI
jgi:16S rRNA processing protein RimM